MEPPLKPNDSDCCNSGCNPCIFDIYEEQLEKYKNRTLSVNKNNCLSQISYASFRIINIVVHTCNTRLITFQYTGPLQTNADKLAIIYKPGQHFLLKGHCKYDETDQFTRAYTPIPVKNQEPLTFTILVKYYEDGLMSQYLKELPVNTETLWRGPYGTFELDFDYNHILLIGQGTGIAPLYAVIHQILNNPECESFMKLFFCCKSQQEILLRDELYECSRYWNFSYEIFLSNQNNKDVQCKYNEVIHLKRLQFDVIQSYVRDHRASLLVLICGSDAFMDHMKGIVIECGVDVCNVILF